MIQLTDKHICLKIPDGDYGEGLIIEVDGKHFLNLIDENGEMLAGTQPLPPGTWRFLFTNKTAMEEQARRVVGWIEIAGKMGYYDYLNPEPYRYIESWEESLRSFLFDKGIDPDKNNYAIIENISNE
jgi:hypothetical protein